MHCSDGWDRTAQICGLAELALDPYFRTLKGFLCLIEKEWLQFGHKFADRHGHAPGASRSETSPVFLQWLDAVHQLVAHFPCSFEFNESLLVYIMDELFYCRFGTFLGNSQKERMEIIDTAKTCSLWSDILANSQRFTNLLFTEYRGVLQIPVKSRSIEFWESYFLRWDAEAISLEGKDHHLRLMMDEIEKRQKKLNSMRLRLLSSPETPLRHSSFLALSQEDVPSSLEVTMQELVYDIVQASFFVIRNQAESLRRAADHDLESEDGRAPQRPWVPDHWASECANCSRKFTKIRRKHHCRNCGNVFCEKW